MSRVFISYVREDAEVAERLYRDIKKQGADPWLDKHDLMPGTGWRGAIRQAVRRSSHFIAIISRNSIHKRGYAQREIREALEVLQEIPPDEIYLIPVRLDDTTPPYEQLQDLHYVDLFPDYAAGLRQIVTALQVSGGVDALKPSRSRAIDADAEKLKAYRALFDRAAFQFPCIFEFALLEVEAAIQDISAAVATGRVYSRDGRLLMEVPPLSAFDTTPYAPALEDIRRALTPLRHTLASLSNLLSNAAGITQQAFREEFHHMEFFLMGLIQNVPPHLVKEALDLMDRVDSERNAILKQLNAALEKAHVRVLPYITLSSRQLMLSADLEEDEGRGSQRWDDFYLRTHRKLREALGDASSKTTATMDRRADEQRPINPLQRTRPTRRAAERKH